MRATSAIGRGSRPRLASAERSRGYGRGPTRRLDHRLSGGIGWPTTPICWWKLLVGEWAAKEVAAEEKVAKEEVAGRQLSVIPWDWMWGWGGGRVWADNKMMAAN